MAVGEGRGCPSGAMIFGRRSLVMQRRWVGREREEGREEEREREREREEGICVLTFLSFCEYPPIGRTQPEARGLKSPIDGVFHGGQCPWPKTREV